MEFIAALWLPILLSAIGVFVVSSILHMATPMHKADYKKLGKEKEVLAAMRELGVVPGEYMFPACDAMKDMATPEYQDRCKLGPVGHMVVLPNGIWNMNKSLLQWFAFTVVVGIFVAYITDLALPQGSAFSTVFRFAGTAATMSYALGVVPNSIWKGISWTTTGKFLIDGLLYGLTTGAIFAWLWPSAV
ncbi:MAG: hypothetical protein KDB53_07925 [Planctomycetes bacterium]|nr:hypothetical protein [Planctomycetota bacterium]